MAKRKLVLGFIFFILSSVFVWAQDFHSHLNMAIGLVTKTAITSDNQHLQIGYGFDINAFDVDSGLQLSSEAISFGADATFKLVDLMHFKLFAAGYFGTEMLLKKTFSTDTFLGLRITIPGKRVFSFSVDALAGLKSSKILAIEDVPSLLNFDIALQAKIAWEILEHTKMYYSMASYDFFYHPLFFAPVWKVGVDHNFSERISFTAEFGSRTIDFFTLSAFSEGFFMRIKMEYRIR